MKIPDFLKKRVDLPRFKEILLILRTFPKKEKIYFFIFLVAFVLGSISSAWKISSKFLTEIPTTGGSFSEGIIGTPRFVNPILAISDTDHAMTQLLYSGLLRTDNKKDLETDLAEKYEISEDGLSYTFTLKKGLVWSDGEPITSDDIIYTVQQAKNPTVKSPKRATWEGVEIEKIDEQTIIFWLKKQYTPFLENLTMGILPKHIWKEIAPEQMILSEFNIKPIGSGPYKVKEMRRNSSGIISSYELTINKKFSLQNAYIKKITIKFYPSEKELITAYKKGDVDNITAIAPQTAEEIKRGKSKIKTLSLPRLFGVFFNQNNAQIFAQKEVRQALNYATDKDKIVNDVLQGYGTKLDYPIPPGTLGALPPKEENSFSQEKAVSTLKKNGWKFISDETDEEVQSDNEDTEDIRYENGTWQKKTKKKELLKLEFSLTTADTPDLKQTAQLIKEMWEDIGIKINLNIFEISDLNQNVIRPRKYDALLFGEIVGRDPDPFAFWHSSQRNDPGLNIAMYANITADSLLEEARVISDSKERELKYQKFQEEVDEDTAAIFLYSPLFVYITPSFLKGLDETQNITIPSERFSQIYKWHIKTSKIRSLFIN